jgi:cellulose synthase/poly-beta-1,6-N-acetylglucosamine synthase-like glycosyltransferase
MMQMLVSYLTFVFLTVVMLIYLVRHYIFTLVALYHPQSDSQYVFSDTAHQPLVSVLIPARDEEDVIGRILQRMTELTYPRDKLEIIVVDDASTDTTGEIAEKFAQSYSHIKVVHRSPVEGGKGKADALNEGLKHAKGEIVYCFDADYYPQRDILEKLTIHFVDPEVGAVQGRITVLNEPESLITRLVTLERIGGYRVDQTARNGLRLVPQFGGTVGGVRRSLLEFLGGWTLGMLAEDTDLTFRVYLAGYKIRYVNDAECYEEAVGNWREYWSQRYRWARGHMQCAFKHWWSLLKSEKLLLREKIDGFLLLNVYFLPILVGLSWILGAYLFLFQNGWWIEPLWVSLPIFVYSTVGNFAPFFEIGIGAYLDGRERIYWLIPLLPLSFVFNVFICSKAFLDLCLSRVTGNKSFKWIKTVHKGRGNSYIQN